MRYLAAVAALGLVLTVTATAGAVTVWENVPFDSTLGGAVSYNASGNNVVVSGGAFYETIRSGGWLGTQEVHGDGIDKEVVGNFAMYGVFHYTDSANVLGWAMANANTLLAIEVRARGVQLDFDGDDEAEAIEVFKLDAVGMPGVDYLTATFADLAQPGYTQLAPGVWMDIALDPDNHPGFAAMSVVLDGYVNTTSDLSGGWPDTFDAIILSGNLGGAVPGQLVGSGIRVAAIPEPVTMAGLVLGIGSLATYLRRRKAA